MSDPFTNICLVLASTWTLYVFFYKIILPGIRDRYRYKLFAQRDRLHRLFLSFNLQADDKLYSSALDMLNMQIRILDEIDVPMIAYALISEEEQDRNSFTGLLEKQKHQADPKLFEEYSYILVDSTRTVVRALRWNSLSVFLMVEVMFLREDARLLKTILGSHLEFIEDKAMTLLSKFAQSRFAIGLYPEIGLAFNLASQRIPQK
mgnify:CR=1 FL=1